MAADVCAICINNNNMQHPHQPTRAEHGGVLRQGSLWRTNSQGFRLVCKGFLAAAVCRLRLLLLFVFLCVRDVDMRTMGAFLRKCCCTIDCWND